MMLLIRVNHNQYFKFYHGKLRIDLFLKSAHEVHLGDKKHALDTRGAALYKRCGRGAHHVCLAHKVRL